MLEFLLPTLLPAFFKQATTSGHPKYGGRGEPIPTQSLAQSFLGQGAKTLASTLAGKTTNDKSFSEELQTIIKSTQDPKASKYIGGSTTPTVTRPNMQIMNVMNPRVANAMRNISNRLNTDKNLETIKSQYVSPTIQQGTFAKRKK